MKGRLLGFLGAMLLGPAGFGQEFNMTQTISDGAQRTTLAFSGLALMTGNLESQSFFPPGKVADYTGFQYLRDNDPDNMGHNTSFLTRIANNVLYLLDANQLEQLKTLAMAQQDQINYYGFKRFALMKAFRRLVEGTMPEGATGLDLAAVKAVSRELYLVDGQISFDRALLYANIINSFTPSQKSYLDGMKGQGWGSWPDIPSELVRDKTKGLTQTASVAVMTYAGDLFSWYAGSLDADVYFCPERHGTYFGSFYIKDAPAIGQEGYSIDEQLTATAGSALCNSAKGYVTLSQAALISSLVDLQRNNLYAGTPNIVSLRTQIATLLRSLLVSTGSSDSIRSQVLALSGSYGELDGANNYQYATVFVQVFKTLTQDQKTRLGALRQAIMSGTYSDGTAFDFSICTTPFLYSAPISDAGLLSPYIANTDYLFALAPETVASFTLTPATGGAPLPVTFFDTSRGSISTRTWDFGDGKTLVTTGTVVAHTYPTPGTYSVSLSVSGSYGGSIATQTNAVIAGSLDTVGDGIPDWWRASYFGGNGRTTNKNNAASSDPDQDGVDNAREYWSGTNPLNPQDYFRIRSVSVGGGGYRISFQSVKSRVYTLYYSSDLCSGQWMPVSNQRQIPGTGGVDVLIDSSPSGSSGFYRVGVEIP